MRLWKSFRVQRRDEISYYDTMGEFEAERFAVNLNQLIAEAMAEKQKAGVIFLCIGTDRSTGDSLGPLVGHKLRKCRLKKADCDRDVRQTGPCYEPGSLCSLYPYSFSGSCDRGHRCFLWEVRITLDLQHWGKALFNRGWEFPKELMEQETFP